MRMRKLDLMFIRAFTGPVLMSFAIITFLLMVQFIAAYLQEISGKSVGLSLLGQLFVFAFIRFSALAMPIAVLSGSLMTFGSMGENYELAAAKSCGISLWKMIRPLILVMSLFTVITLMDTFYVIPWSNMKFYSLLYDIKRKKPDLAIKPGYFYSDIDGYVIRISDKNEERRLMYDVQIFNHSQSRGNSDIIFADSARMATQDSGKVLQMVLYHGNRHEEFVPQQDRPLRHPYGRTYFDSLYYKFRLTGFDLNRSEERSFRHQLTLPYPDLVHTVDSISLEQSQTLERNISQISRFTKIDSFLVSGVPPPATKAFSVKTYDLMDLAPGDTILDCYAGTKKGTVINDALSSARGVQGYMEFLDRSKLSQLQQLNQYLYEYHTRWAIPFAAMVFLFIGVALGSIIRKGGLGLPGLISVVFFIAFYLLLTYGKKMVKEAEIHPVMGAWLPVICIGPLAIPLFLLAMRDASVLTLTAWVTPMKKLFGKMKLFVRRKPAQN